jgi:carbonic anhydrase/acetyltransferase-like protein (isoleucine patch superfamily)
VPVYALGDHLPAVADGAFLHPEAVLIGAVTVAAGASVWPGAVLRGDYGSIEVGPATSIQDGAVLHATEDLPTRVGARCVVGHLAHLEGCVVEDDCLIGSGSVVLHQVTVRAGALVGAGALVPNRTEIPSGAMALGVPCRIRPDAVAPGAFAGSVERYLANAARYREQLRRVG